ncbi:GntR family transcriptional regulator [Peptostreptococcus russellii]|uniref:GntR family transcriptional regulator n=1 Tax=Peptostreptococcus russellii TaxID=215200 RepID=UPI001A9BD402|nr:GntR family transcriptional regulator [Peptostreptococcus russellii]
MNISEFNFNNNTPIYLQIAKYFQAKVFIGELSPGDVMPSRRELAGEARVNLNTVQKAYAFMEDIGLIKTERNRFSSITDNKNIIENLRNEFIKEPLENFILTMKSVNISKEQVLKLIDKEFDNIKEVSENKNEK